MTKEQYLAMCEQLGADPDPKEMPIEFGDLPYEVQQAHEVFHHLPDRIDGFSGIYLGKDLSGLGTIMDILKIDDKFHVIYFLRIMTAEIARQLEAKRPKNGK